MSAHIQHLVSGTLPSITGKLPSSDARHEVSGTPSSASQEGRQAGGMPLSPEGRLQQQSKVSLETKLVQTSPNWQLGRVSVEGLRPVEVKMKGSSTAEPGVGRGLAVAASMETGRRGTGGEEIGRLRDKGMAKWPEGGRTGGQAGGRTGGQAGGERTQVSRDLEETSRAAGTTSGQQHWRVATEVTGTVASRNEVVEKIGKHNGIKSSRKAMSFSPTGASPTYPAGTSIQVSLVEFFVVAFFYRIFQNEYNVSSTLCMISTFYLFRQLFWTNLCRLCSSVRVHWMVGLLLWKSCWSKWTKHWPQTRTAGPQRRPMRQDHLARGCWKWWAKR